MLPKVLRVCFINGSPDPGMKQPQFYSEAIWAGVAGPAVSLLPLILAKNSCGLGMAVACLTAFMGLQAFAYSGFHAYVQACPILVDL